MTELEPFKADLADNPCPNCGHHRRRYLMSSDPDAPGLRGLLRGEGDPLIGRIAWTAVLIAAVVVVAYMWGELLTRFAI